MNVRTSFSACLVGIAACSGRPLVDDPGEGGGTLPPEPPDLVTDSADDAQDVSVDDDGEAGEIGGDGVDDDDDGDDGTDTEPAIACVDPQAPDVIVGVWPGQDPVNDASDTVLADLQCFVLDLDDHGDMVGLTLECATLAGPPDIVYISLDADEIAIPVEIDLGVDLRTRLYTWRDGKHYEEFAWRSADYFALYRDGVLLLAGGQGASFPTNANGDHDPTFFDPFVVNVLSSNCPGPAMECQESTRGVWEIGVGDEIVSSPPFSVVEIGGYEVHLGELVPGGSVSCNVPLYSRVAFALARL